MEAKPPKPPTNNNIYSNNHHHNVNIKKSIDSLKAVSESFEDIRAIALFSSTSSSTTTSPESEENLIRSSICNKQSNNQNPILIDNISSNNSVSEFIQNSDCHCTNISIMQLFHEMKQEFPTVPDHIVNQCVIDNCHDRETCIKNLKRELASHPNTVQAYPAQVLRNHHIQQQQNLKILLKPTRPAPIPIKSNNHSQNCNTVENNNNNYYNNKNCSNIKGKCDLNCETSLPNTGSKSISRSNVCDLLKKQKELNNVNDIKDNIQKLQLLERKQQSQQRNQPQRPTTLSFREPVIKKEDFQNQRSRIIHKPVRRAPLPPIISKSSLQSQRYQPHLQQFTPSSTPFQSPQSGSVHPISGCKSDQSYSSPSIQSPLSFSDSGESEISVNISLSPCSEKSRGATVSNSGIVGINSAYCSQQQQPPPPPQATRRMTSINVTPEPPYTRDFMLQQSQNPRCYTSLNLTLRKPSVTPQSPIDISAGPGLTYSSSSFDSRRGYQKSFHITVTDQGGTFSASQIRPRTTMTKAAYSSNNNILPPIVYPEQEVINSAANNIQTPSPQYPYGIYHEEIESPYTHDNYNVDYGSPKQEVTLGLIQRQKNRKEALARCLQKNKQKLERVQNEIKILKLPVIPGESERLDSEIEKLRCDCENILQEIENAKRNGLPNDEYYINEHLFGAGDVVRQRLSQYQYQQHPHMHYHLYHSPQLIPPVIESYNYRIPYYHQQQYLFSNDNHQNYHQPIAPPLPPEDSNLHASRPMITTVTMNPLNHQQQQHQHQLQQQQQDYVGGTNSDSGPPWTCSMCTFQNHPLLKNCECCDNVRIEPEITSREDIHIHLSPNENRVIHSWVVS